MPIENQRESWGPEQSIVDSDNNMMSLQDYLKERHDGIENWKKRSAEIIYQLKDQMANKNRLISHSNLRKRSKR